MPAFSVPSTSANTAPSIELRFVAIPFFILINGLFHSSALTRDAAKEALKNVPLLTSHVETFEEEMRQVRRSLLGETKDEAAAAELSAASSSTQSSSETVPLTSDSPLYAAIPSFDEVDSKLSTLKTNLRENPLPVDARVKLELRLAEFGSEIARLKHITDLKKKDAIAADIYDQLSREVGKTGSKSAPMDMREEDEEGGEVVCRATLGKYAVRELTLTLDGESF